MVPLFGAWDCQSPSLFSEIDKNGNLPDLRLKESSLLFQVELGIDFIRIDLRKKKK